MILIRSLFYYLFLTLTVLFFGLTLAVFGWGMPWSWRDSIATAWAKNNLWLQRVICGLSYRLTGSEHLPRGAAIVMAKHQSAWETIALRGLLRPSQSWILKRELLWIPVFGWALAAIRPIAIDRKAGRQAARQIIEQGRKHLAQGRTVIIFPEGTRTAPGEHKKYGIGGGLLAAETGAPVIPIAHNAGVFWKRRSVAKFPGTIQVVVGSPIAVAGKSAAQITREVERWIEGTLVKLPAVYR